MISLCTYAYTEERGVCGRVRECARHNLQTSQRIMDRGLVQPWVMGEYASVNPTGNFGIGDNNGSNQQ